MKANELAQDPVADVRAAREAIARRFDYNLDRLFDYYQECEKTHKVKLERSPRYRKGAGTAKGRGMNRS